MLGAEVNSKFKKNAAGGIAFSFGISEVTADVKTKNALVRGILQLLVSSISFGHP